MSNITVNGLPFGSDDPTILFLSIMKMETPIIVLHNGHVCTDVSIDPLHNSITYCEIDPENGPHTKWISIKALSTTDEFLFCKVYRDPTLFNTKEKSDIFLSKNGNYYTTRKMVNNKESDFKNIYSLSNTCTIHSSVIDCQHYDNWKNRIAVQQISLFSMKDGKPVFEKMIEGIQDLDKDGKIVLVEYDEDIIHPPFIVIIGNGGVYDIETGEFSNDFENISQGGSGIKKMTILGTNHEIYPNLRSLQVDPANSYVPPCLRLDRGYNGNDNTISISYIHTEDFNSTLHTCVKIDKDGKAIPLKINDQENYAINMAKFLSTSMN